jgi:hypothetical protein
MVTHIFSKLRLSNILSIALAAGLTLSPDTLALFGNSIGAMGWLLLLVFPVGILIHLVTVHSFRILHAASGDHIKGIQRVLGRRLAAILLICGKLPFAVCASAGLVVSAGFVFNEVFAYWFPNFAFAFILLALIVALNMFGRKIALVPQVVVILAACIGMLIMAGSSFMNRSAASGLMQISAGIDYRYLAAAVTVLVGFDMGLYADWNASNTFSQQSRASAIALFGSAILLALWGFAAMCVVSPEKLASSTVPYMTVARRALGQTGRLIIGMVIICGVFAAVNSMLHSVSTMINQLTSADRNFGGFTFSKKTRAATILFIGGASAFLMAMGFAGEPVLETWIRSSLILWLAYYAFVNISAYLAGRNGSRSTKTAAPATYLIVLRALSIAGTALAAAGLVSLEPEPVDMLVFIATAVAAVAIVVSGVDFYTGRRTRKEPKV